MSVSTAISLTIASIALILSGINTYRNYFYEHRVLLFTMAPEPRGKAGTVMSTEAYRLSPIFSNSGNHTEIVLSASIAISPTASGSSSHRQLRGTPVGPFVLKGGDAIAADISMSYDQMLSYNQKRPAEQDLYVRVVALAPRDGVIAVDVPVSHVSLGLQQNSDRYTYSEKLSTQRERGVMNLFDLPKSEFPYDASPSATQATMTLELNVRKK